MIIYVDADACPKAVKELLYRTAEKRKINTIFVANNYMNTPLSDFISSVVVPKGADIADDKIVEMVNDGDLVITSDVPLADRVIDKGALVITSYGKLYTKDDIKHFLSKRNFYTELRNNGIETSGPPSFSNKEITTFANQLDRILTKILKNK
ncbi:YaiI/YqxD family protein [bacterium]|nr:MAG: YaiI/YqxD family protein [bacterium]